MSAATVDLEHYDPMEHSVQQNPFPHYAALRRDAPVYHRPGTNLYMISRLDTVLRVLRHSKLYSSRYANPGTETSPEVQAEIDQIAAEGWPNVHTMLTADPPRHTRYRKTVHRAFSTQRVEQLEPAIREIVDAVIDPWPARGRVDFANDFGRTIPIRVVSRLLSIPPEREADVKRWSKDFVASLGVDVPDERRLRAVRGIVEAQQYLASELEARRREPGDDMLSDLVQADFEDGKGQLRKLEMPELVSIVQQIMVAGGETSAKLFNEIMKLLIEYPAEWKRIQDDPSTIPAMIEEGLRMASPNQGMFRLATADSELEGVKIPKGALLWVMFGSANRDERVFEDPDRFDPTRPNLKEHVGFGRGAHFCLGATLARLESKVMFEQLAKRIESVAFAPGNRFEYEPSYILRGLDALEIEVAKFA